MVKFFKKNIMLSNLSWDADVISALRRSESRAWMMVMVLVGVIVLLTLALIVLLPLKRIVPYVVTVDKLTGETSITSTAANISAIKGDHINEKHWLKRFLMARERYDMALLQSDYNVLRLMSSDKVWNVYEKQFSGDQNIVKLFGSTTQILPSILSISISDPGSAVVRFESIKKTSDGNSKIFRKIANIKFEFNSPLFSSEKDLIDNPFGFVVNSYRVDIEYGGADVEILH